MPPATPRIMALAALLLPPLLWAGNFIVGRAVRGEIDPMMLSFGRWVIALLCLLPFALGPMRRDWPRYWALRWRVLGVATVGVAAFNSLVYLGLRTTTATNGLLLNTLIPLLIVLLGALLYRQKLQAGQRIGLALSLAGALTLVLQGHWTEWGSLTLVPGDAIVLTAMLCWALYTLWLRQLPADLDRIGLMGVQIVVALVELLPFLLAEQIGGGATHWNTTTLAALFYVGLFPSVLAYLLYAHAVQRFGPALAGLSIHLMPVYGVLLSMLLLGERPQPYHAAGIAAIAAGLLCSHRWRRGTQGGGG
ncbi:DMT family transporter [Phaeospirillum tilakii]|uniref:DMT family transporter n=1 Tax=Phaeospirillum tilakii TaxID=741673 RepID=A0ABW5CCA1_9PROT